VPAAGTAVVYQGCAQLVAKLAEKTAHGGFCAFEIFFTGKKGKGLRRADRILCRSKMRSSLSMLRSVQADATVRLGSIMTDWTIARDPLA